MFNPITVLVIFLIILFSVGIWALTPIKKKEGKYLICPKTGQREINPNSDSPCVKCSLNFYGKSQ